MCLPRVKVPEDIRGGVVESQGAGITVNKKPLDIGLQNELFFGMSSKDLMGTTDQFLFPPCTLQCGAGDGPQGLAHARK